MPASTRTAAEAAAACGTSVAQIIKSLVFQGRESGRPYLLLVSGSHRVDERYCGQQVGEPLIRPDAEYVRRLTGYAIGGVPPFGHASELGAWMDETLLGFSEVWAAAGTPRAVMRLDPRQLFERTGARLIKVC